MECFSADAESIELITDCFGAIKPKLLDVLREQPQCSAAVVPVRGGGVPPIPDIRGTLVRPQNCRFEAHPRSQHGPEGITDLDDEFAL